MLILNEQMLGKWAEQKKEFVVTIEELKEAACAFSREMQAGLKGEQSSLKMLPSFLEPPSGEEKGMYLAVDFGGSNVRVLLLHLFGAGRFEVADKKTFPLVKKGEYNYTTKETTAEELFGVIAEVVLKMVDSHTQYALGHTFSFPCKQNAIDSAELLFWTKEINTKGVEREDVGKILNKALQAKGLKNVVNNAIINDTVGTLLTKAYLEKNVTIGSICGTGHNSCYVEPCHPLTKRPMIVNLESGNFDKLKSSSYDLLLDKKSTMPGVQKLEKMSSGYYVGPLATLVVADFLKCADLACKIEKEEIEKNLNLEGADLSKILSDNSQNLQMIEALLKERISFCKNGVSYEVLSIVKEATLMVVERAAKLVSATYAGILQHVDCNKEQNHVIAVDGSLYEKMPYFAENMAKTVDAILENKGEQKIVTELSKDGSGVGAAIAAAAAKNI